MRAVILVLLLLAIGVTFGVVAYVMKSQPEPALTEMTITVVTTPEEAAEQAAIQKILDASFAGSEVKSWWRHPNQTTTLRGQSKTNGMFDGVYDQKLGTLHIEYDRDRRPLP